MKNRWCQRWMDEWIDRWKDQSVEKEVEGWVICWIGWWMGGWILAAEAQTKCCIVKKTVHKTSLVLKTTQYYCIDS